jgi:hypothetical protein
VGAGNERPGLAEGPGTSGTPGRPSGSIGGSTLGSGFVRISGSPFAGGAEYGVGIALAGGAPGNGLAAGAVLAAGCGATDCAKVTGAFAAIAQPSATTKNARPTNDLIALDCGDNPRFGQEIR